MRRLLIGCLAVIGGLALAGVAAIAALVIALAGGTGTPALSDAIVLTADLNGGLAAGAGEDTLSRLLFGGKTSLRDFIEALDRAGGDPRVKSLFVRLGDDALGLAKTQEVRDAFAAFRAKGTRVVAFADTFGEFGPGTRPYYLAAAADEIWLQPLGSIGLTGLRSQTPFLRGLLDLLGVKAEFARRSEYKSAANPLTETAMTAPEREEVEALLSSMIGQIERGIAADRHLSHDQVRALIDRAPLSADEAKAGGLVDHIGYLDEAQASARAGSSDEPLTLSRYLARAGRPHRSGPTIALIFATGMITRESGAADLLGSGDAGDAHELAKAFRAARRDKNVRAVLFRIDSPGGSAVASETIWREVAATRAAGKPVIVSMGDTAASGGYYIAAPADKIVAEPGTITGSIGVLAGKVALGGLFGRLGISVDGARRGANADMFDLAQGFSPAARERLERFVDVVYRGFKAHVADGRKMSAAAVEAVARGRVWSGADAKEQGLVDALGGYAVALDLARRAAGLPDGAPVTVTVYPEDKGTLEALYEHLSGQRDDLAPGSWSRGLAALRATVGLLNAASGEGAMLLMPPIGEPR